MKMATKNQLVGGSREKKSVVRKMMKCLIAMWFCTTITFIVIYLLQKNYPYYYLLFKGNDISQITQDEINANVNQHYARQIPRIIHQTYKDKDSIPEKWKKMSKTCKKLHPHWEFRFYSDEDMYKFVHKHYPEQVENFQSYPHIIQRVDAFRYMLLHHYGGVYLDLDVGCKQSLEPFLIYPVALPETDPIGVSNDVLFSAKQHPFLERVIAALPSWNYNYYSKYLTVMISTGPLFLSAQLSSYYYFFDDYYYYHDNDRMMMMMMNDGGDDDMNQRGGNSQISASSHQQQQQQQQQQHHLQLLNGRYDQNFKINNFNADIADVETSNFGINLFSESDEEIVDEGGDAANDDNNNNVDIPQTSKWDDFFFKEDDVDADHYLGDEMIADVDVDDSEDDHLSQHLLMKRKQHYFDDGDYYRDVTNPNVIIRKPHKADGVYVIQNSLYSPSSRSFFKHTRGKSWHGNDAYYIFVLQDYLYIIPYLFAAGVICILLICFTRYFTSLRNFLSRSSLCKFSL